VIFLWDCHACLGQAGNDGKEIRKFGEDKNQKKLKEKDKK